MSIGSTIKKLRRERDMTQEQLAEYIGITANAVSQWECDKTSPDISQLPTLANLFEVTTDYLLGVDVSKKQATIECICNDAWNLCNAGNKDAAIGIIRNALISYPNSFKMMSDFTIFLYQRAFHQECSMEDRYSLCKEAAAYIDKILAGCTDMKTQSNAISLACNIFPVIGRNDDVLRLIANIPDISKSELLTTLYSGDKLIEHTKDIICHSVSVAADRIIGLASLKNDYDISPFDQDDRIALYQKAISLYKTLYEQGDFFFDAESLAIAEKHIADIFAERKDTQNALKHLGECVKYTTLFDTYDETKDTYISLIPSGRSPAGINWNNTWNTSHEMLLMLKKDANYDFVREDETFKNLITLLIQTDNIK